MIDWSAAVDIAAGRLGQLFVAYLFVMGAYHFTKMSAEQSGLTWRNVGLTVVIVAAIGWYDLTRSSVATCDDRDPVSGACLGYEDSEPDTRPATVRAGNTLYLVLLLLGGAGVGFSNGRDRYRLAALMRGSRP